MVAMIVNPKTGFDAGFMYLFTGMLGD